MLLIATVLCFGLGINLVEGQYRDVTTDQGVVRGYTVDADDVYSFYGIPYATAPTGEDRFKAALPPSSWEGVFNATENRIVCPQPNNFNYEVNIMMDCLRVHVFVPVTQETNLPIYFYVHGGGYQSGFPGMYSPINLVKRGMIVVNFNYRVGVHGFLCLNNEFAPGNAGMKDQVAALRWVKRNIANFGGDPDNITVGGSSSGSFSTELQILSPMSNGLFNKASSVGGSTLSVFGTTKEPLSVAEQFATQFGVSTGQDLTRLESFYRTLSDEQIYTGYDSPAIHKQIGFVPCVETHDVPGEEKFLTEYPIDILINGNYEKVTYIGGVTPMEGADMLLSYDLLKPMMEANFSDFLPLDLQIVSQDQAQEVAQIFRDFYFPTGEIDLNGYVYFFSDSVFLFPQYSSARLHTMHTADSYYFYLFSYNGTINLPAFHAADIWGPGHVVPLLYMQQHIETFIYDNMTEEEYIIQDKLSDLMYNFIKDGVPRSDLVDAQWTPVSDEVEHLEINNELEFVLERRPLRERMDLWDSYYNYPYMGNGGVMTRSSISIGILSIVFLFLKQCF